MSYSTEDWRKRLAQRPKLPVGLFVVIACVLVGAASIAVLVVTLRKPVRHEIIIEADEEIIAPLKALRDAGKAQEEFLAENGRLQREWESLGDKPTSAQRRGQDRLQAMWSEHLKRSNRDEVDANIWFVSQVKGKSLADLGR